MQQTIQLINDQQDAVEYLKARYRSQHRETPKGIANWNESYSWYNMRNLQLDGSVLFRDINFSRWNFMGLNAKDTDFRNCNFYRTKFTESVLDGVEFNTCNMRESKFPGSKLIDTEFLECDLDRAIFDQATITGGIMIGCNLMQAHLINIKGDGLLYMSGSNINAVDFSGSEGLHDPVGWLENNFLTCDEGWLVYKKIGGTNFMPPSRWVIEPGSVIQETSNPNPTTECGCGVNFGTMRGIDRLYPLDYVWLCLIPWKQSASITVPIGDTYKARCNYLKLVRQLSWNEAKAILGWELARRNEKEELFPDKYHHPLRLESLRQELLKENKDVSSIE